MWLYQIAAGFFIILGCVWLTLVISSVLNRRKLLKHTRDTRDKMWSGYKPPPSEPE